MLTAHHLSKSYNISTILDDVSFTLNEGDRAGLIGPNGSGKTTLLRILAGEGSPDKGSVTFTPPNLRIGYLAQGFSPGKNLKFGEVFNRAAGDSVQLAEEVEQQALALAANPEDPVAQMDYAEALSSLEQFDPERPAKALKIIESLGLGEISAEQTIASLSGGQKTRLALALVLLEDPQLLLLDEPTNHLDIQMLEWLEGWLHSFPGAALIVSHDRTFLDNTVTRILDLDPESHRIVEYTGNYTDYLDQYLLEKEKHLSAYRDQVAEIRRMRQDIARTKSQAYRVEQTTTSRQPTIRRYAKKVAKKALSREKKMERYLESEERVEKPKQSWQMKLEFEPPQHQSQEVVVLENASAGYPDKPPLLVDLNLEAHAGSRIAIIGPNGSGKTTLLRLISGQLEPRGGKIRLGASVRLGYMAQEQEFIDPQATPLSVIQQHAPFNETEARSFLHYFLFSGDEALRQAGLLSYGERARLALARLVAQGSNLLLLDEPINHLDIPSRERFEQALTGFDGTVLAVVHDRYFIERFASELWVLEDRRVWRENLVV